MTTIVKKKWIWDECFNNTEFKLGLNINIFLERNLVIQSSEDPNEYEGINNIPWKIKVKNGIITGIFYQKSFFSFIHSDLWDLELYKFEKRVNKTLTPIEFNSKTDTDIFYVAFRGNFIAIAGIIRKCI